MCYIVKTKWISMIIFNFFFLQNTPNVGNITPGKPRS